MGIVREAIVKIRFIGKRKVAQFGSLDLVEARLRVERAPREGEITREHRFEQNVAHISYQALLPPPIDYVSVKEASMITGISEKQIQKLCRDEIVQSHKDKNKWIVHLPSLRAFLSSQDVQ